MLLGSGFLTALLLFCLALFKQLATLIVGIDDVAFNREQIKLVNFITATRRNDKKEFNGKRYVKIENDPVTE